MKLRIVDSGSGNLRSVAKAFEKTAPEADVLVSAEPEEIRRADRLVLPGVGAFGDTMDGLKACSGLREAIDEVVFKAARPFLGICVGMQILAEAGHEYGTTPGLGWIPGTVDPLEGRDVKIPHMGWNTLTFTSSHPLFAGLGEGLHVYFVHSYAFHPACEKDVLATTTYGGAVVAAVGRENIVGVQFHPEKSQRVGEAILANFLDWKV